MPKARVGTPPLHFRWCHVHMKWGSPAAVGITIIFWMTWCCDAGGRARKMDAQTREQTKLLRFVPGSSGLPWLPSWMIAWVQVPINLVITVSLPVSHVQKELAEGGSACPLDETDPSAFSCTVSGGVDGPFWLNGPWFIGVQKRLKVHRIQ